ncbi:MAG: phosphoribosyltransferase [Scytolyngbya sp. HA4215-MV1]|jgi:predicted phosphoribosyltransferase|nr:phosphoribosyltransferase [Scytolyngbya sp. HA4215-MV1]
MSPFPRFRNSDSTVLFADRWEAGEKLAQVIQAELEELRSAQSAVPPIVYALPRGGIPVAEPIARQLQCPLDLIVSKKITRPDNPELAIGAVTSDGYVLWADAYTEGNDPLMLWAEALSHAQKKAQMQLARFAPSCPQVTAKGALALIVDDGIATGMTMAVAAQALRDQHPAEIWICAPVAPASLMPFLRHWSDRVLVLETPEVFYSVSRFYAEFTQVETEIAIAYLQSANR